MHTAYSAPVLQKLSSYGTAAQQRCSILDIVQFAVISVPDQVFPVPGLLMWLCLQAAHHIGLLKPGSYVAAGPSAHEVAVGDAAGIVWLYDLRQPDAPTLRLPCNSGHAVSCIQWTSRQGATEARSIRRSGGTATTPSASVGEVPSGLPSGARQARRGSDSAGESSLPRMLASPAVRDGIPRGGAAPHALSSCMACQFEIHAFICTLCTQYSCASMLGSISV